VAPVPGFLSCKLIDVDKGVREFLLKRHGA
jgi:hypothetical protein